MEDFVTRLVHDPMAAIGVIHRARSMPVPQAVEDSEEAWKSYVSVDPASAWHRFYKVNWMDLPKEVPAVAYLLGRGFKRETLLAFDVRFTEWAEYPVVFQINDGEKIVGYQRRRVDGGEPKYLYNRGFDGANHVAYYCVDPGSPCLVVEGVLDLMMAAQHGMRRVAALLGWRLTPAKVLLLSHLGCESFVWATDNTPTGEDGYGQAKEIIGAKRTKRFEFPLHRKDIGELTESEFKVGMPTWR